VTGGEEIREKYERETPVGHAKRYKRVGDSGENLYVDEGRGVIVIKVLRSGEVVRARKAGLHLKWAPLLNGRKATGQEEGGKTRTTSKPCRLELERHKKGLR